MQSLLRRVECMEAAHQGRGAAQPPPARGRAGHRVPRKGPTIPGRGRDKVSAVSSRGRDPPTPDHLSDEEDPTAEDTPADPSATKEKE